MRELEFATKVILLYPLICFVTFGQGSTRVVKSTDVNGDGIVDTVALTFIADEYAGSYNLEINGFSIVSDYEELIPDFDIVDIDSADKFKEIAIYESGPSDDPATTYYFFDGTRIVKMGKIEGNRNYEYFRLDGKGKISTMTRGSILHTWYYPDEYLLTKDHMLKNVPKDLYIMNARLTVKREFLLQKSRTDPAISIKLKVGEKITIVSSDNVTWCLVKNSKGKYGWFSMEYYDKVMETDTSGKGIFDGLLIAD
jgi:hypothetical protein